MKTGDHKHRHTRRRLLGVVAAAVLLSPVDGEAARRIVSMNPCVDAILLEVADPATIASISHYSHDADASSIPLDLARRFPANGGTAEEVIAARPDLVIAGPHVALPTIAALKRLGIALLQIPVPVSVAQSRAQIARIASRIGREAEGARLIARIDAAVATARHKGDTRALIWRGGGLVPGAGTLADDMLSIAGYRNASADYGLKQWDILPIERLLAAPPAIVFSPAGPGQTDRMLSHPVLARAQSSFRIAPFPPQLLNCGGPTIIAALDRLKAAR